MRTTIYNQRKCVCQGCPDRYPACSDHCKKEEFLKEKAEKEKIRENRKAYYAPIWAKEEKNPWKW